MNFRIIFKLLGRVLLLEAAAMLVPLATALVYREPLAPFLYSALILAALGGALSAIPAKPQFFIREGFFSVGLIWLATGLLGAIPFYLSGYFPSVIDCIFESCSGFTTTGATILTDIEVLSQSILLWRAFSHWLGGMGVLVLTTAVVPSLGIRSHYLAQIETPGPTVAKLVPTQAQSSKILYHIYCALTILLFLALRLTGMPLYDCLVHAFSTAGTGGFSCRNASVGAYGDPVIEMVVTVFMLLFSLNFSFYFLLLSRRVRDALRSDELWFFLAVVALATTLVAVNIRPLYSSLGETMRYAFFQVVSIISTAGFVTTDYTLWPNFAQLVLVLLMFCGACAGSTAGGIKCSRMLVLWRCVRREIHRVAHPRSVEVVRLNGKPVTDATIYAVMVFAACYVGSVLVTALVLSLDEVSFSVSFSAALTCVSNGGPGLDFIGSTGNFSPFSNFSKLAMSLCMIAGRLEMFPIVIMLNPRTWSRG